MNDEKCMQVYVHEEWVDSLKGSAMCGVLLIHSGANSLSGVIGKIGTMGQHGVQLFFVISAYLTFASLARTYANTNKENNFNTIKKWWKNKILKLIPVYYIALLLYLIFMGEGESYWLGSEGGITVFNVIAHLLLLHGLNPYYINSILGIEWYIGDLFLFYIVAPYLYKKIDNLEKSICFLIVTSIGVSFIDYIANFFISQKDAYIFEAYIDTFWFFAQLPVFAVGIFLYFFLCKWDGIKKANNRLVLSLCVLLGSIVMLVGEMYGENHLFALSKYVLLAIWFCGIIVSQNIYKCPLLCNSIFAQIGTHSYPIYLFHWLFLKLYEEKIHIRVGNQILDWLIRYAIVLGISYILSVLVIKLETRVAMICKKNRTC